MRARLLRRSQGQATLEFVLLLPLLLFLTFAAIQFIFYGYTVFFIDVAAHEGARIAAEQGRSAQDGANISVTLIRLNLGADARRFVVRVYPAEGPAGTVMVDEIDGSIRTMLPWFDANSLPIHRAAKVRKQMYAEVD